MEPSPVVLKRGGTFRSLRHSNMRIYFVGLLVSNIGSWLQFTATSVLIYGIDKKATDVGLNTLFQFLPMLILGAWAGGFADRHDRRTIAIYTQALLGLQAVFLAAANFTGNATMPVIFASSLVLGIINAMDNPARRGLVTELVESHEISNAMSLNTTVMTGSRIFGPAMAGLLIGPLGTAWLFTLNAFSFIAVLVSLFLIKRKEMFAVPVTQRSPKPVREAFAFVNADPLLKRTFIVFTIVSTFAFNFGVVLPKLVDVRWATPAAFPWMLTMISIGSIAGSLATARLPQATPRWFMWATGLCGVSAIGLAWSPNLVIAFMVALPLGAGGTACVAAMNGLSQMNTPPEMRGRMLALVAVAFLGSTPIGGPITGWVADAVGVEWALAYGGIVALLCVPMLRKL